MFFLGWKLKKKDPAAGKQWFSAYPVIWHQLILKTSVSIIKNVHMVYIQNYAYPITEKGNTRGQMLPLILCMINSNPVNLTKEKWRCIDKEKLMIETFTRG